MQGKKSFRYAAVLWNSLPDQLILTDLNRLFPTGMTKTVNVQLVRLDFNVLIPQAVQPHTKVFYGFYGIILSFLAYLSIVM